MDYWRLDVRGEGLWVDVYMGVGLYAYIIVTLAVIWCRSVVAMPLIVRDQCLV